MTVSFPSPPDPLPGLADLEPLDRPVLDDISIVIPTLGRDILDKVLASMVAGTTWPCRILVVDQSGERQVAEMLEHARALGVVTHRVQSVPRGRAAALNLGISQVQARYLAITDDDCVVAPDWLETMRSALIQHHGAIVSGQVLGVGDEEPVAVVLRGTGEVRTRPSLTFDLLVGGNCGMSKELFMRIGPYDEDPRVNLAEDTEYAYRALRSGARLAFVPEVRVWHYAWRDADQREHQFRGYARSHGAFYGKYLRQLDTLIAARASIHLARACRRWIRATIAGEENLAAHGRAYTMQLVPGIVNGLRSPWECRTK